MRRRWHDRDCLRTWLTGQPKFCFHSLAVIVLLGLNLFSGKEHNKPKDSGCAGAVAWAVSFPLDCVRAGVQGQDFAAAGGICRGAWRVFQDLLHQMGAVGTSVLQHTKLSGAAKVVLLATKRAKMQGVAAEV
jgi:hypothetical protein